MKQQARMNSDIESEVIAEKITFVVLMSALVAALVVIAPYAVEYEQYRGMADERVEKQKAYDHCLKMVEQGHWKDITCD